MRKVPVAQQRDPLIYGPALSRVGQIQAQSGISGFDALTLLHIEPALLICGWLKHGFIKQRVVEQLITLRCCNYSLTGH
jgi:hypothetical protein